MRHAYGTIGEIELEPGNRYRPLISASSSLGRSLAPSALNRATVDTAILVRSTSETLCVVDAWNLINQQWAKRSCSGPGGLGLNVALLYASAARLNYTVPPAERPEDVCPAEGSPCVCQNSKPHRLRLTRNRADSPSAFVAVSRAFLGMLKSTGVPDWTALDWLLTQDMDNAPALDPSRRTRLVLDCARSAGGSRPGRLALTLATPAPHPPLLTHTHLC